MTRHQALKYLDVPAYEAVKASSLTFNKTAQTSSPEWVHKNLRKEKIRSISLDYDYWATKYGEGRVSISWFDLQTALRNQLPQELVKDNHRCINVTQEPELGYVCVDIAVSNAILANPYAHWSDPEVPCPEESSSVVKSLRAKLVIAADGINSTVRQVLYQGTAYQAFAKPEYSGFAAIMCQQITNIPEALISQIEGEIFQDASAVTVSSDKLEDPSLILFRRSREQLGYLIHAAVTLEALEGKSGEQLRELALQHLEKAHFPKVLLDLVSLSTPETIKQRPYYIHRASISEAIPLPSTAKALDNIPQREPLWSVGRIVLVGDAAHGMPPFMAQGTNQGFEDVVAIAPLVRDLAEKNLWDNQQALSEAFMKYATLRRPLMEKIQQATLVRLTYRSDKEWQDYSETIYTREFG